MRTVKNELIRYTTGQEVVPMRDRAVAKRAKVVRDDTRIAALKSDASMALAAHIMEGLVGLDNYRQQLAQDDPMIKAMLMEIEAAAIRQAKSIQNGLHNDWGF